jgi:hypothetical protein
MRSLAVLTLAGSVLGGCSAIDGIVRTAQAHSVQFEVWNRTLDAVTLTDAAGRRLEVAACDRGVADAFRIDEVRVHTKVGYVWGFGSGGNDPGPQYLVIVAEDGESFPTLERPTVLPPCAGHPNAQPGVFLDP